MSNITKIAADLIDHTYREKLAERIEGEGTGKKDPKLLKGN
jgi:hypothetical protein